ncbi:hypothetical protein IPA_06990 [Ignicoccus pacificus DSM 13166]|uniref:Uncharacterized protein n=1 Tax=Ignicoccus pacificus DSM 13166 TaxID=940294 RepID=A0A977PLM1_9CREN|nr:hypothetical protein IPA_06990 [Ignicoccus pacificus DSM 13166]
MIGKINSLFTLLMVIAIVIDFIMTTATHLFTIPADLATNIVLLTTGAAILFGGLAILTEMAAEMDPN